MYGSTLKLCQSFRYLNPSLKVHRNCTLKIQYWLQACIYFMKFLIKRVLLIIAKYKDMCEAKIYEHYWNKIDPSKSSFNLIIRETAETLIHRQVKDLRYNMFVYISSLLRKTHFFLLPVYVYKCNYFTSVINGSGIVASQRSIADSAITIVCQMLTLDRNVYITVYVGTCFCKYPCIDWTE